MQHFMYRIKRSIRSGQGMFWALVFPLFLGFVFKFMFGNLAEVEQFSQVPVGVVEKLENQNFLKMFKEIETEELKMFEVSEYETGEDAQKALQDKKIKAYIVVEGQQLSLVIRQMDIYTSLVKSFVDQYQQNVGLIECVAQKNPQQLEGLVTTLFSAESIGIEEIELKGQDKSPYTQYFYALLAMTCLIASMFGMGSGVDLQADVTALGARRNVSPKSKMKQFAADLLADLLLYSAVIAVVLLVLVYVYGQDFGNQLGLIWLATVVGVFVALACGYLIATYCKGPMGKKNGMCVSFFMVSSFLGGLQMAEMPYILEESCPIINRINPATLLVNAFKSLAVFGDYRQYAVNVATLLVIGVLFMVLSALKLRRTKYASL